MKSPCWLVNELTSHNQEVRLRHGQGDGRGPDGRSAKRRTARPECVKRKKDAGTASAGAAEGEAQASPRSTRTGRPRGHGNAANGAPWQSVGRRRARPRATQEGRAAADYEQEQERKKRAEDLRDRGEHPAKPSRRRDGEARLIGGKGCRVCRISQVTRGKSCLFAGGETIAPLR